MLSALPSPGAHGGDARRVAAALGIDPAAVLDLSMSLNPMAPDPRPVVAAHLDALGTYPDPSRATAALAEAIGVDPARLLLTNGGAEAIALVATDLGVGWAGEDDFSLYRRHLPVLDPSAPRIRSNPHNPSGRLASPEATAAVWDEAFYPLATGRWTRDGDDALVVGSLTKLFACPGLRIGYVLAPDQATITRLAARQPEWSVGGLACAAVVDLLATCDLRAWSAGVALLRRELTELLLRHGLEPQPSHANYVLCTAAPRLRERLAPHGIVVRDCASFGMVGSARVAVPSADGLCRLAEALEVTAGT
ncbi:MAG: aminotransferase class I/II-fold pyridoxal phosphate-dependent enzyme [Actinomycetota bacterium]|nr:aminotransferase class I/II-fold pyridoxal phosphate-dependent enzyme [Actinomycetota bacterium]